MRSLLLLLVALTTPWFVTQALAQTSKPDQPIRADLQELNLGKGALAIDGFDPVAYFPEGGGKATKGKKEFSSFYRGVTYRFASEAHRKTFEASPDRFEPAYGGWCAYAMAKGDKVEIDPETYVIQDGELLLFYNSFFSNTKKSWAKEGAETLREQADQAWSKLHPTPERDLSQWHLNHGLALAGYDPVALMASPPEALQGKEELAWTYKGVTYRFASARNRASFRLAPWSFEPALGGSDPVRWARSKSIAGSPKHALVYAGHLYVFEEAATRETFQKDPEAILQAIEKLRGETPSAD